MKTVYKYTMPIEGEAVYMPRDAQVIKCAIRGGSVSIWAIVTAGSKPDARWPVHVAGTGHPLPLTAPAAYFDTVFDAVFVWHVFIKQPATLEDN